MKHLAIAIALLLLLTSLPLAAQFEEEDLDEPDLWEELRPVFEEAVGLFNSASQGDSVALFDEFLTGVAVNQAFEEPGDEIVDMVVQSHYLKAQARFNVGEDVTEDLRALLAIEPGFAMDRGLVSSKLVDRYEELQREEIGRVEVRVDPPDARVSTGRWVAGPEGALALPVGTHRVVVERSGFTSLEQDVEIEPDQATEIEVLLERAAAVVSVRTAQDAVGLYIDDRLRATTARIEDLPEALPRAVLDDLAIGSYEIDFRKVGYRSQLLRFDVEELSDYVLSEVELIPTSGTVTLAGLPDSTVIRVNGNIRQPDFTGTPTLELTPGDYLIELEHRTLGLFEARVSLADTDEITVQVRLRPALALLGILGADETGAEMLLPELQSRLSSLGNWALIDRSHLAAEISGGAGAGTQALRQYSQTGQASLVDWKALQKTAADRVEASLYVLAVLSNDVLAETAEVFIWPGPPHPAHPDSFRVVTKDLAGDRNLALLDQSILQELPRIGATIVDSHVNGRPVVVQVNDVGAAARAGLQPGDEILKLDDVDINSVEQLHAELDSRIESHARTGRTVQLTVSSAMGDRTAELPIELVHRILSPRETDLLYSAAVLELSREGSSQDIATPKWVIELNQALVYLHSGDADAIQQLRRVEAPEDSAFGPATVSYFLGLSLLGAGSEFTERARGYIEEAAADPNAHLFHIDGPAVAPRAQARLTRGQ